VADYRLRAVRDVRARTERARVGELASAVGDARATQARLDAAKERSKAARNAVDEAVVARDTLLSSGATSTQLAQADRFIARLRKALGDALAEEVRCEVAQLERDGHADAARLTLRRARAERDVIERHFERWRASQKKLGERRDD
jgi:hypothetical protein